MSERGTASLASTSLSSITCLMPSSRDFSTLSLSTKVTKPKPLLLRLMASFITTTSATGPNWLKYSPRAAGGGDRRDMCELIGQEFLSYLQRRGMRMYLTGRSRGSRLPNSPCVVEYDSPPTKSFLRWGRGEAGDIKLEHTSKDGHGQKLRQVYLGGRLEIRVF